MVQKIATRVFMAASLAFGVTGILLVITGFGPDQPDTPTTIFLGKILFACVFIILPSFALSVATKYLDGKH
jgi:hypothetical protein